MSVELAATGGSIVKTTVAGFGLAGVLLMGTPPTVTVVVTVPAWVLVMVKLAIPLTSVVAVTLEVTAVPWADPPVTVKVTVVLGTGLPLTSRISAWILSAVVPSSGEDGISVMTEELAAEGIVATKLTVAVIWGLPTGSVPLTTAVMSTLPETVL